MIFKLINLNKISIYSVLSIMIYTTVSVVLTAKSLYIYHDSHESLLKDVEKSITDTSNHMDENLRAPIINYSPAEYEGIIESEIKVSIHILAIVLVDYNMGEIVGADYITGRILDSNNKIVELLVDDKRLDIHCCVTKKSIIEDGKKIAEIMVYGYIDEKYEKIEDLFIDSILDILLVLVFVAVALHISIKKFVVCPLKHLVQKINGIDISNIQVIENTNDFVREFVSINDAFNFSLQSSKLSTYELETKSENLKFLVNHDTLTQLPNRSLLNDRVGVAIKHAKRHNNIFAMLFIDLDNFKKINDTHGHKIGDKVLLEITKRLNKIKREIDTLSRIGGDEFIILVDEIKDQADSLIIAKKILHEIGKPIFISATKFHMSCSIGVSFYPDNGDSYDELLRQSDTAMHDAKSNGKNRISLFDESMTKNIVEKVNIENDLREAINKKQIVPFFQPQIDSKTGKIISLEALVRWQKKFGEFIPPSLFLPIAYQSSLITDIDWVVLEESVWTITALKRENFNVEKIAVNITDKELHDKRFVSKVKSLLKKAECDPAWIELEITEDNLMTNINDVINTMDQLSKIGIKFALDDFGTGYSSLSYLKKLPISILKIDKSFVDGIPQFDDDVMIVNSIISMAKSLKLDIVAEGVESEDQERFLIDKGCDYIQGYFHYKPLSSSDLIKELIDGK